MRVCIVYDCLFPWTVGGEERYLRHLAEDLARAGHDVTYLTRRQWAPGERPDVPGVRVVAVSRRDALYDEVGRRRIAPPLRFGRGVLGHLVRHRGAYNVVHTSAFPYFSLLAARLALAGTGVRVLADWTEVWSRSYWREYLGPIAGPVGWAVQRLCARLTPEAFVYADLHGRRLREEGMRGPITRLPPHAGDLPAHPTPPPERPVVAFVGRHIPEKRVRTVPPAVAAARRRVPELRALILGDGPDREALLDDIATAGLQEVIEAPGFVSGEELHRTFEAATCLLAPSNREGYGLAVVEAAAAGTPTVVVAAPDNASVELIEEGVNGFVAASTDPEVLAEAIVRCIEGGEGLRASTAAWFERKRPELTEASAVREVEARYLA